MPEEKRPACDPTLRQIMDERHALYAERAEAQNRAVNVAMEAAKEAVIKAERAIELRLAAMNEFRAQMSDERNLYATKEAVSALADRVTLLVGQRTGAGSTWAWIIAAVSAGAALALLFHK